MCDHVKSAKDYFRTALALTKSAEKFSQVYGASIKLLPLFEKCALEGIVQQIDCLSLNSKCTSCGDGCDNRKAVESLLKNEPFCHEDTTAVETFSESTRLDEMDVSNCPKTLQEQVSQFLSRKPANQARISTFHQDTKLKMPAIKKDWKPSPLVISSIIDLLSISSHARPVLHCPPSYPPPPPNVPLSVPPPPMLPRAPRYPNGYHSMNRHQADALEMADLKGNIWRNMAASQYDEMSQYNLPVPNRAWTSGNTRKTSADLWPRSDRSSNTWSMPVGVDSSSCSDESNGSDQNWVFNNNGMFPTHKRRHSSGEESLHQTVLTAIDKESRFRSVEDVTAVHCWGLLQANSLLEHEEPVNGVDGHTKQSWFAPQSHISHGPVGITAHQ